MHAGEGGEAPPLTSSKSNKSTSPSCVRMWTVGKCGKRAWELVCVGVRVTGGRQGRGCLAGETPFACLRTIIALVKLTSQEGSMDVVQGFVLTAAAPCTGLCAGRRKSLKPLDRGIHAQRVLRPARGTDVFRPPVSVCTAAGSDETLQVETLIHDTISPPSSLPAALHTLTGGAGKLGYNCGEGTWRALTLS